MSRAVPWGWESFLAYARALGDLRLGVNVAAFVGHSQIRAYVMGEAAWERGARPDEIAAMAAELEAALAAGAIGLSFSLFDKDRQGRPVPSCLADDAELDALCTVLAVRGGVFQFVPCGDTTEILLEQLGRLGAVLGRHDVTGLYNIVVHVDADPERSARVMACLEGLHAKGVKLYAMASPKPFELSIGFAQTICFIAVPAWNELVQADPEAKRRLVADPAWRARARADAETCPSVLFPFDRADMIRIRDVAAPGEAGWAGRSFAKLIADRGGHPSDVLADWVAENDFAATFIYPIANTQDDKVAALLKSPLTFVSGSDAGAHLMMFCAAGDATLLLTRFVRERGDLSLEAAVHAITGRQAELLGLADRGMLAPGKAGDVVVFALDELVYGPEFSVADLPGGGERLTRAPGGYRYTVVNGVVVQEGGRATGELPAGFISSLP
jgi:N-acyl-D-aspartate/D-glutamate deacylase